MRFKFLALLYRKQRSEENNFLKLKESHYKESLNKLKRESSKEAFSPRNGKPRKL